MAVFGRRGVETDYGIKITYVNRRTKKLWYGSDSLKRDGAHNLWANRPDVMVVEDIERSK